MPPRFSTIPLFHRAFVRYPLVNTRPTLIRSFRAVASHQKGPPAPNQRSTQYNSLSPSERAQVNKGTTLGSYDLLAGVDGAEYAVSDVKDDGFAFHNGTVMEDGSGVFLWQNQCFKWRPVERSSEVEARALNTGVLELNDDVWGMLDILHPRPELLIIGSGAAAYMLSRKDRERLTKLGITMEAMDTNTAASYFNLLAQERPRQVAAALLVGGFGKKRR